jgi:proteic killer suppression protein
MRPATGYIGYVIKSFQHRGLKRLFERGDRAQIGADMIENVENRLAVLNRAAEPEDMKLPGFHLHELKGDRGGTWSVTVRANWSITWRFEGTDAVIVNLEDYH